MQPRTPLLLAAAVGVISVSAIAPRVWLVLLTDGLYPGATLAAAAGLGAWPVKWLRLEAQGRARGLLLALGLGSGVLGLLVLALGVAGGLNRVTAWGLLGAGGLAGAARIAVRDAERAGSAGQPSRACGTIAALDALLRVVVLCALVPSALVSGVGACLPPGLLWSEEGGGYDVLEYHLQSPREYFEARRVGFLPHNVYASFPQQLEMLYLLQMHLMGDAHDAAIPSQLLHAAYGWLAVAAAAVWAAPGWPAILTAVVMGTVPWVAFLGCLAYVENGVLFFATLSAGLVVEPLTACTARNPRSTHLAAGVLAGFAAGCKYPAAAMVAAGLSICIAVAGAGGWRSRLRNAAVFAAGAAVTFGPWLMRNAVFTGNPVYPFAYSWFGGASWSADQQRQWNAAHRLKELDIYPNARWLVLRRELFLTGMFGLAIFGMGVAGGVAGVLGVERRRAAFLAIWVMLILGVWMGLTHMPGRFAVPLVVPLALCVGGTTRLRPRVVAAAVGALGCLAAFDGGVNLVNALRMEELRRGVPFAEVVGATGALVEGHYVNRATPPDAYVWIVGDAAVYYVDRRQHYSVVFNRDPWIEFAQAHDDPRACLEWLRSRGVTHVVFSWAEIRRLAGTYGFSPQVRPEWVGRLVAAGLRPCHPSSGLSGTPWADVYEVPR